MSSASQSLTGRGIAGTLDGRPLALGNRRLLEDNGLDAGRTGRFGQGLGSRGPHLVLADRARRATAGTRACSLSATLSSPARWKPWPQLKARHISSHLLTGDNRGSGRVVAQALGIDDVHAEVLPADKAATVAELKKTGVVAMVGDGINDAPALAAADIGIAMGGGTDVAMHAAGITLMRGDPRLVPAALEISRKTYARSARTCSGPLCIT